MNTPRFDDAGLPESAGLSRRMVMGAGVTGLALAVLARSSSQVSAQDATPATEGGLPPGIGVQPLISVPLDQIPDHPVMLELIQLTLEPGANSPATSAHGVLEVMFVQEGTVTCPGGEGRVVYAPDGTVTASGEGDLPVPAGSALVVPPDAIDGARNDGTARASALLIHFPPMEEAATPTT